MEVSVHAGRSSSRGYLEPVLESGIHKHKLALDFRFCRKCSTHFLFKPQILANTSSVSMQASKGLFRQLRGAFCCLSPQYDDVPHKDVVVAEVWTQYY